MNRRRSDRARRLAEAPGLSQPQLSPGNPTLPGFSAAELLAETASANARKLRQEQNSVAHVEAARADQEIVARLNTALAQLDPYELHVAN